MKTRWFARILIVALSLVVLTACGVGVPIPTAIPGTTAGPAPVVTGSPAPTAVADPTLIPTAVVTVAPTVPPTTEIIVTPTVPPATEAPVIVMPTEVAGPTRPILPGEKPPLAIADCPFLEAHGGKVFTERVIGFASLDGKILLASAPLTEPAELDQPLFLVGVVELAGPETYAVAVDVESSAPVVPGRLIACEPPFDAVSLRFTRAPQVRNPERVAFLRKYDLPDEPALPIDVTIQDEQACFVVLEGENATRYCSGNGSAPVVRGAVSDANGQAGLIPVSARTSGQVVLQEDAGAPLSVRDRYPGEYAAVRDQIAAAAFELIAAGFLRPDAVVFVDEAASEIEDHARIERCRESGECPADLIGAAAFQPGDPPNAQVVGVLRIPLTISPANSAPILPGDYVVTAWHDSANMFIGATISGVLRPTLARVENQQIPATLPSFTPAEASGEPMYAEISAFRLFGRGPCILQRRCP